MMIGRIAEYLETPESGLVEMDVEMHWFRIVMESAAHYPYEKQ